MNDTPTPRTDALTDHRWATPYDKAEALQSHARQLERELAECSGKYDALVTILERKQDRIDVCERDLAEAKASLSKVLSRLRGCGYCDPCIGGRPDQCAVGHLELKSESPAITALKQELTEANKLLGKTLKLPGLYAQLAEAKTVLRYVAYNRINHTGEKAIETLPDVWQERVCAILETPPTR